MATDPAGEQLIAPEEVQQQLNLVERVKAALGTDDDFLAALLANQVQLARLETVENELLRDLRDGLIQVDIDELDIGPSVLASGFRNALSGQQVSFPEDGTRFHFPAAPTRQDRITIDLIGGKVTIPNVGERLLSTSLESIGAPRANSLWLWADDDLRVFTFDGDDRQTGVWENDQCGYITLQGIRVARLKIESSASFGFRMIASTSPLAPQESYPTANHQDRFGYVKTSVTDIDDAEVAWISPSASSYGKDTKVEAAEAFGAAHIHMSNIGQQTFILEEVADNADAEFQVRLWQQSGEQKSADVDVHGSASLGSANVATIPQGDFVFVETDIAAHIKAIHVKSSDGSEVEVKAQYGGFSPGLR